MSVKATAGVGYVSYYCDHQKVIIAKWCVWQRSSNIKVWFWSHL